MTTASPPPDKADPLLGKVFAGRYQVNNLVASGGMGTVYRARQRGIERWVALKVLDKHLSADPAVGRRFYSEMRAMARVEHPHVVRVYDFGHSEDGELFLVMELLRGRTLSVLLDAEAPLAPARVAKLGAAIARGLAAAHAAGVVHRDLKPDNVLLTDQYGPKDWPKILDFGLARVGGDLGQEVTGVGKRVGTPCYMAPEYIEQRQVDARSDLYALGAVLYEAATGRLPYKGSAREVLQQQIDGPPLPPSKAVAGGCPAWLDALVLECMAASPDLRPASAEVVARRLEAASASPDPMSEDSVSQILDVVDRRRRRDGRLEVFVVASAVASVVAGGGLCLAGVLAGGLVTFGS